MDKFLEGASDPLVLVAFLNFAGIVVGGFFAWQASRMAQKSIQASEVNTVKLDTMKEKVQKVKDKVEHIEEHTNSMQDEMIKTAKELGKQEGKVEILKEIIPNDTLPPSGEPA